MTTTFILGGARSGKSRFAENLVTTSGLERHYVATGVVQPLGIGPTSEMISRCELHTS